MLDINWLDWALLEFCISFPFSIIVLKDWNHISNIDLATVVTLQNYREDTGG
jgi:hypothetical protein